MQSVGRLTRSAEKKTRKVQNDRYRRPVIIYSTLPKKVIKMKKKGKKGKPC